jgi:hypothetical protein
VALVLLNACKPQKKEPLPEVLRRETKIVYDTEKHDLRATVASFFERAGGDFGAFPERSNQNQVEEFVPTKKIFRDFATRQLLYNAVAKDEELLQAYESLILEQVIPALRKVVSGPFYYQYPPSLRLQPGPSAEFGKTHSDDLYGHTAAEINFWLPISRLTPTLHVESEPSKGDFHPLEVTYGEMGQFYGVYCRHFAPANPSPHTRVSFDFRIGIAPHFDPDGKGKAKRQHGWRKTK